MASAPKRKRLSKAEKRQMLSEKATKSAERCGRGIGSRQEFVLPAKWETDIKEFPTNRHMVYVSPGKTRYNKEKAVKELKERGMDLCFDGKASKTRERSTAETSNDETSNDETSTEVDAGEYDCTPDENMAIEDRFVVCESSSITRLIDNVNRTSKCATPECNGILVAAKVESTGLGGTMNVVFVCNRCHLRTVHFQGSALVEGSKRTVVGLALVVAFFLSGHGFAKFNRTLNQCLGITALSKNRYYDVVKAIYPLTVDILNEMCEEEKQNMKALPENQLGCWKRAVVTSDGVWHTRGHFSKNGSFIVKNYMNGGLLWFGHKCMKGGDDVLEEELYQGTAKSIEGRLADECYKKAKDEVCCVEVVWQDGDSSSSLSVEKHFGKGNVFKCGGHVGRAHGNNLKDMAKMKEFSSKMQQLHKAKFPDVQSVRCKCTRHSQKCGCLSDQFIKAARINHFCCLQQCNTPEEYARRMRALGEYHCRDIHVWEREECGFHPSQTCSCGSCTEEEELSCQGKPYSTKNVLHCPFHRLAYRIECERRAEDAMHIIHKEMGRGNSNQCEAHFNVLPHFRAKTQNLCRLHYITSRNCGLCQGNMTWCHKVRGSDYHWIVDLYQRLNLPVVTPIVDALKKDVEERAATLEKQKGEESKRKRVQHKVARAEDQAERKRWVKRQSLRHTYGHDDADDDGEDDPVLEAEADTFVSDLGGEDQNLTTISGKKCKCGSFLHQRTSHRACPLNKASQRQKD